MLTDQEWTYKDHKCKIELDHEEDVTKAWHTVVKPDGVGIFADITPYDRSRGTLERWIDAGYPHRKDRGKCGPLHREDLDAIIAEMNATS